MPAYGLLSGLGQGLTQAAGTFQHMSQQETQNQNARSLEELRAQKNREIEELRNKYQMERQDDSQKFTAEQNELSRTATAEQNELNRQADLTKSRETNISRERQAAYSNQSKVDKNKLSDVKKIEDMGNDRWGSKKNPFAIGKFMKGSPPDQIEIDQFNQQTGRNFVVEKATKERFGPDKKGWRLVESGGASTANSGREQSVQPQGTVSKQQQSGAIAKARINGQIVDVQQDENGVWRDASGRAIKVTGGQGEETKTESANTQKQTEPPKKESAYARMKRQAEEGAEVGFKKNVQESSVTPTDVVKFGAKISPAGLLFRGAGKIADAAKGPSKDVMYSFLTNQLEFLTSMANGSATPKSPAENQAAQMVADVMKEQGEPEKEAINIVAEMLVKKRQGERR